MFKGKFKITGWAFIFGIIFSTGIMVASATTAYGSWKYYGPYLGYSYKNQSLISDDYGLCARSYVANQASANVPTGYLAAMAKLYNSSGYLINYSSWGYNSVPAYSISVPIYGSGSGTYYSQGYTAAYNGNGYSQYQTYRSPNIVH